MWVKSIAGCIFGLLFFVSLSMNLFYLAPLGREVYLLTGYVGGFILWAGIMTYIYCQDSFWQALKQSALVFLGSLAINTVFFLGVVG